MDGIGEIPNRLEIARLPPSPFTVVRRNAATRLARRRVGARYAYCDLALSMNGTDADTHHRPNEPAHAPNASARAKPRDFARQTIETITELPSNLDAQMKSRPYIAFGIALAIGTGAGILLRSRILRTVIASATSYAVIELGRAYLRETWRIPRDSDKS